MLFSSVGFSTAWQDPHVYMHSVDVDSGNRKHVIHRPYVLGT